MKVTKSLLIVLSTLVAVSLILTSCGPATPEPSPVEEPEATEAPAEAEAPAEEPTEEPTEAPVAEEPIEIVFWQFSGAETGARREAMDLFLEEFHAANPNIEVNMVFRSASDIRDGLIVGASSPADLPDAVVTQIARGQQYMDLGLLADLDPYWDAMPEEWQSQFSQASVDIVTPDGYHRGIPYTGYATFMYRNLGVLKEAGIDPDAGIKDWADWLEQMKQVNEATGAYGALRFLDERFLQCFIYAGAEGVPAYVLDQDGELAFTVEDWTAAYEFMVAAEEYGGEIGPFAEGGQELFTTNQVAFFTHGPWPYSNLREVEAESADFEFDVAVIPGETEADCGGARGGEFLALIDKGDANDPARMAAAWTWLAFLADHPQQARYAARAGMFVLNDTAMAYPEVQALDVIQVQTESFNRCAMDEGVFFGDVGGDTDAFFQPAYDAGYLLIEGSITPGEAAEMVVTAMQAALEE